MEAKCFAIFALVVVLATVFVSTTESIPVEMNNQAASVEAVAAADDIKSPGRQGRYFGGWPIGYPGIGYGGMGGLIGGSGASSASASAASSSTTSGIGMYGRK